ncbi:hypothetical protein O3M35_009281 [Rhynocoris fuscipes]|uniref:Uncharacterized protein n=1 Tax=Rhynocoris fuscipes TaxID=488301 RepID=A0AAW1D374_9HEMI
MDLKVIVSILAALSINVIHCSKKRGALTDIRNNGMRNRLEYMNEGDHYSWVLVKYPADNYYYTGNRFHELPYRYPMRPNIPYRYPISPLPYTYTHVLSNIYKDDKDKLLQSHGNDQKHEHYMERFPTGLTYEVTEHINYGLEFTTKQPLLSKTTTQKSLGNPKKNAAPIVSSTTAQQINNNVYNKENQTIEKEKLLNNSRVTLEAGPDVMNEAIRNGHARKREIKSAVPVDILLDDSSINSSKTITNISQYLNKIFADLDQNSVNDLLSTLKNEYLISATPSETKLINETFKKLTASLSNNNNNNKNKRSQDIKITDNKSKAELLAKAAAALDLLAEEKLLETQHDDIDSIEDFLDDESYHDDDDDDTYSDISLAENNDEISEPSFLELISIASKHKAGKALKNDQNSDK